MPDIEHLLLPLAAAAALVSGLCAALALASQSELVHPPRCISLTLTPSLARFLQAAVDELKEEQANFSSRSIGSMSNDLRRVAQLTTTTTTL